MITDVVIEPKVRPSKYSNEFVVTSQFMHGDGNHYETRVTTFSLEKKELLIEFLNWLDATQVGLKQHKYLDSIEGHKKFGDSSEPTFDNGLEDGWPIDCDSSCEASYKGSELDYFDAGGHRFSAYTI